MNVCPEVILPKLVKRLAEHYDFCVEWNMDLNRWIIKHTEFGCKFLWTSDSSENVFLDDIQFYFNEVGADKASIWL